MLPYWILFIVIAIGAWVGSPGPVQRRSLSPFLMLAGLLIAVMIGFRYHVGGDWWTYERFFTRAAYQSLREALSLGDPGYQLLNWTTQQLGAGIWLVNLVCGTIFSWGLIRLAGTQPRPWLSLLIAIPYLVIVVAMGYSRQAVAIGLMMAGLASLYRHGSVFRYAGFVFVGTLFHRTAAAGLPLAVFGGRRSSLVTALLLIALTALLYDFFVADSMEVYVNNYIGAKYTSQGAAIRVAMSLVPATLFLLYRKRLGFNDFEASVWKTSAYVTFLLLAALFVVPSSTVIDRLALYLLPLQLIVLPRICGTLVSERAGKVLIILYCAAIQFVWLNYAQNAQYWLPYRLYGLTNGD